MNGFKLHLISRISIDSAMRWQYNHPFDLLDLKAVRKAVCSYSTPVELDVVAVDIAATKDSNATEHESPSISVKKTRLLTF